MKSHIVSYARAFVLMPLLFLLSVTGKGQNQPVYNVPGPEIANLGLYGQVPVSYYTGVPDISVPLHEIKVGKFSMPITASYHVRSVKPNQTPGPLGLGWNLIAGGYITRNVRNIYDEKMDSEHRAHGFYGNYSKMKNITLSQFDTYNGQSLSDVNYFELAADEFSFNFCGYMGNFYLNENGGWTVVSEQDVKVIFEPATGFATFNQIKDRVNYNGWNMSNRNQRYFIKFTLLTPDGTRFEFGGIDATEFCIPYYARNNSDLIATTWHLTKIITPEHYVITIDYDSNLLTCDLHYQPFTRTIYNVSPSENPIQKIGIAGLTGFLLFPSNIKTITTPNETIAFTYNRDRGYGRRCIFGKSLYWTSNESNTMRRNIFSSETEYNDPANQFFLFTDAYNSGSENERTLSIADSMKYYNLHRIAIRSNTGGINKSIYFDYTYNNRKKLSLISIRDGIPTLQQENIWHPHGYYFLSDYLLPADTEGKAIEYHFKYNTSKKMFQEFIRSKTDSWGFWHGDAVTYTGGLDFRVISPNLEATKAETLTEITYPTGGKSLFEYELNNYSKLVDSVNHSNLLSQIGNVGGLRIKTITNRDRENRFISKKKFYYSQNRVENTASTSSGICRGLPVFYTTISAGTEASDACIQQRTTGGTYAPVTNMNSPDVGYTWVIEESLDSVGTPIGNVRYRFSNYDSDITGNTHLDQGSYYSKNPANDNVPGLSPYTSISFERGKLLSKEYRSANDIVYKKEVYNYSRTGHEPLLTAHQYVVSFGFNHFYSRYQDGCYGWLTLTHTASYLPVSVTETIRSTNGQTVEYRTKTFEYNTHKMLSRETCTMSDGTEEVTTYKYPFDYIKYRWMTNANITSPVIEKKVTAGGLTHTETDEYASNSSGVPYIQKRTVGTGGSGRTEFEVSRVDSYGNPVEMTVNGVSNVLCWGYEGQRLLARVENATFTKLKYLLNMNPNATTMDYSALVNGRSLLPSALFHLYQYDAGLRLQSEITPNGVTTFYKYDNFGRLCEIYYIDGVTGNKKLLESYGYHYYNQQQ